MEVFMRRLVRVTWAFPPQRTDPQCTPEESRVGRASGLGTTLGIVLARQAATLPAQRQAEPAGPVPGVRLPCGRLPSCPVSPDTVHKYRGPMRHSAHIWGQLVLQISRSLVDLSPWEHNRATKGQQQVSPLRRATDL